MKPLAGIIVPFVEDARPLVREGARLAVVVVATAAALAAVGALEPLFSRPYYFPAFAAITLVAVVAGTRHGILATLLFGAGFVYWFVDPRGELGGRATSALAALAGYSVTGCFVAGIGGALRSAYAQLHDQHRQLDRIVAQREDLLHAMTHDIRSPLSVIGMNAALLSRAASQPDPDVRRRGLLIQRSVGAMESMLRDLVKVVALESGQVTLERGSVPIEAVLDSIKESLAEGLPMDRVAVALPRDLPPLHADPRRLERVLVNLVSNALKYSEGPVAITAAASSREVVLAVHDDGPGIAAEDLPHVFEKYFRAASAQRREGLGLGLYISRLLVEAHGGRIWAESEPGKGTTFRIAIPALPRVPKGVAPVSAA